MLLAIATAPQVNVSNVYIILPAGIVMSVYQDILAILWLCRMVSVTVALATRQVQSKIKTVSHSVIKLQDNAIVNPILLDAIAANVNQATSI